MYTSVLLVALMGPGALPAVPASETLKWQESYATACKVGQREGKPLAVFIGNGPAGWDSLTEEGKLPEDAQKLLKNGYVCVYIDLAKPSNKALAKSFEIQNSTGLILSTKDGSKQAFWHQGRLTARELQSTLERHRDSKDVAVTDTLERTRVSFSYYPGNTESTSTSNGSATSNYPTSVPVNPVYNAGAGTYGSLPTTGAYSPMTYTPTPTYSSGYYGGVGSYMNAPSFGGSYCPNCRR